MIPCSTGESSWFPCEAGKVIQTHRKTRRFHSTVYATEIYAELVPRHGMAMLGGGRFSPFGTFSEYVVVERDQVIETPSHLDDVHIAAWPLAGVTAWR